ncbi:MAG: OB-fold nucleic acid binding domain-containing protein, partial [Candidatus Hadarchaeales archaeon]
IPPLPAGCVKISEIKEGMEDVDVLGRVVNVGPIKSFEMEGGEEGKVASIVISDGEKWIRVSLWGEWAEFAPQLKPGDAVKLENASVKVGLGNRVELSLGAGGRIIKDHPDALKIQEKLRGHLKISEVDANMPSVNLAGRVVRKLPVVEFSRRDGSRGKVMSVILMDECKIIRASFWDSAVDVVENVKVGDIILIENGYTKLGVGNAVEIHAGKNATIKINPPGIDVGTPVEKRVKISGIEPNACGLVVVGKVIGVNPVREFEKNGRKGKVASIVIVDETLQVRASLWGSIAEMVREIKPGDIVKISRAYAVPGSFGTELGVDEDGKVEVNPPGEEISTIAAQKKAVKRVEIGTISREGEFVEVRGTIVHVVHKKPIFGVCPSCGKSLRNLNGETMCEECGESVRPQPKCVLTFTLDDGTGPLQTTLFGKPAEKLAGATAEEISAKLEGHPDLVKLYKEMNLAGREVVVSGVIRYDDFVEGFEMIGREIREADPVEEAGLLLENIKGGAT